MMGHKICFNEKKWIIIPKLSLFPLLSGALLIRILPNALLPKQASYCGSDSVRVELLPPKTFAKNFDCIEIL